MTLFTYPKRVRAEPQVAHVAVLVAAHRSNLAWLTEMLHSVDEQKLDERQSFEVRIGVDGCDQTSEHLRMMDVPHWFSFDNVGPYVIRNSLAALAYQAPVPIDVLSQYSPTVMGDPQPTHFAPFDIDDVMYPDYLAKLVQLAGSDGIAGGARHNKTSRRTSVARWVTGVCVISRKAWDKLGGYRDWRVAADVDLIARARALGIKVRRSSDTKPLYLRREHAGSLGAAVPRGGDTRIALWKRSQELVAAGELHVEPVTTPLEWREA